MGRSYCDLVLYENVGTKLLFNSMSKANFATADFEDLCGLHHVQPFFVLLVI